MREALIEGDVLVAPSVGTWRPTVALRAPLAEGARLGELIRDGRPLEVRAPAGVSGVALIVAPSGAWVAYGDALVTRGDGALAGVAAAGPAAVAGGPEGAVAVRAETDGTIYLSSEPGAPSFAAVGAKVAAHATLALVEVMKTFTPVRSAAAGTVARVDVSTGQAVREGQVLFWLEV